MQKKENKHACGLHETAVNVKATHDFWCGIPVSVIAKRMGVSALRKGNAYVISPTVSGEELAAISTN